MQSNQKKEPYKPNILILYIFFGLAASFFSIFWTEFWSYFLGLFQLRDFSRLFLPDSALYSDLIGRFAQGGDLEVLFHSYSKSTIVFAFFCYQLSKIFEVSTFSNLILLFGGMFRYYFDLRHYGRGSHFLVLVLLLSPLTIYLAQGPSKEIFIISSLPWLIYGLDQRKFSWVILSLLVIACVRTTFLLPLILSTFSMFWLKSYKSRAILLFGTVFLSPLLLSFDFISGTRESALAFNASRIGLTYYYLHSMGVPFLGGLFIPLRALQNILEPFIAFQFFSDGPSILNVYYLASFISAGLFFACIVYAAFALRLSKRLRPKINLEIVVFTFSAIVVAAIPFIHFRYIYPVLPTLLIGIIKLRAPDRGDNSDLLDDIEKQNRII